MFRRVYSVCVTADLLCPGPLSESSGGRTWPSVCGGAVEEGLAVIKSRLERFLLWRANFTQGGLSLSLSAAASSSFSRPILSLLVLSLWTQ